jgi:hypothetical protein
VREFIAEFAGLAGTIRQKTVAAAAGLSGCLLHDLRTGDDVDLGKAARLLWAMQAQSRPIKSDALGVLGEPHLAACLQRCGADRHSIQYKRVMGKEADLPFVLEVALGIRDDEDNRQVIVGLNWSPALGSPFPQLPYLLGEMRVDAQDPITVLVHLACPRLEFTDRGKGQLPLPPSVHDALEKCVRSVAWTWKQAKRRADREGRMREQDLERLRKANEKKPITIKQAAFQVMVPAYMEASSDDKDPANARQIMYSNRRRVLALTGGRCWSKSSYFTQTLLPELIEAHPELTASWDIVYDARGRLVEPHTGRRIDLGTLKVRGYIADWKTGCPDAPDRIVLDPSSPTCGPANRYKFALFIEKEGFNPQLERYRISERFDVAIMSTKGMSVTAARQLVERLSEQGVTILVFRDFDFSGFSIVHKLGHDSRRYRFRTRPHVIDCGLRLEDVQALGLQSEVVVYSSRKDPRENLRKCGATEAECNFLVQRQAAGRWVGERVELNAMPTPQFIAFVERKLTEAGVGKVVPEAEALANACRRAWWMARLQEEIDATATRLFASEAPPPPPPDLAAKIAKTIKGTATPWDRALWEIVQGQRPAAPSEGP